MLLSDFSFTSFLLSWNTHQQTRSHTYKVVVIRHDYHIPVFIFIFVIVSYVHSVLVLNNVEVLRQGKFRDRRQNVRGIYLLGSSPLEN